VIQNRSKLTSMIGSFGVTCDTALVNCQLIDSHCDVTL
jgi:hypothetical protein